LVELASASGGALAAAIRAGEQPELFAESNPAQHALRHIVEMAQPPVVFEAARSDSLKQFRGSVRLWSFIATVAKRQGLRALQGGEMETVFRVLRTRESPFGLCPQS
jgi:hypothetical protein